MGLAFGVRVVIVMEEDDGCGRFMKQARGASMRGSLRSNGLVQLVSMTYARSFLKS